MGMCLTTCIKLKQVRKEKNSTLYNAIVIPTLLIRTKTFDKKHSYINEIQREDMKFLEPVEDLSVQLELA
jgi:hypothetical protein